MSGEGINALDAAVLAYSSVSSMRQQLKPTDRYIIDEAPIYHRVDHIGYMASSNTAVMLLTVRLTLICREQQR